MNRVLITGANGFVGSYLARLLVYDHEVIATGQGDNRLSFDHPHLNYIQLDFTLKEEVEKVLHAFKPDVIVHSGAMSKPDECEREKERAWNTNVNATKYLLEAAQHINSFFVFLSTDFIFDGEKGFYKEDDPAAPVNYYGETKLAAEELVKNYGGNWAIVRTVLVYGDPKSGRQNLLTTVASGLQKKQVQKIFDDQLRTPTYVEDLVAAIRAIIDRKKTGVFHISGKDALTPYQMAVAVAKHLGLDDTLIKKITAADMQQPAKRPPKTGFDISKARQELDYDPVRFEEGLRLTFHS